METSTGEQLRSGVARRLVRLMAARLALSVLCFAIALALDGVEREFSAAEKRGFYLAVAFAFLSTAIFGALIRRIRRVEHFAAAQVGTDLVIVTALVYFSGGSHSIFLFLYPLVALYGAVFLGQAGALAAALGAAFLYGLVLTVVHAGWLPSYGGDARGPLALLVTTWGVHTGALVLVAGLASALSRELKQTGEALDQRTSDLYRLRTLHQRTVESLTSGLLTTDTEQRITSFNPEAERITGATAPEVSGRHLEEVISGLGNVVAEAVGEPSPSRARTRIRYQNRSGEELHLGVAASILKEADGSPSGFVVIFQDVTHVVEMEGGLRRSERLAGIGQLAASIAHEIRNPLAAISGSIQMLRGVARGARKRSERERLMEIAIRETDRLNLLITDFLRFARPRPLQRAAVDLCAAVEEVLKMYQPVKPADVRVHSDLRPGLHAHADPTQVRQLLWNLVLNATQAMDGSGTLRISSRALIGTVSQERGSGDRNENPEEGVWAEIVIADDGVGIPPEVMDRIFDPFFTTRAEGTGLGLPTVHRIVEDHHGTLNIESRPGTGTAVTIRLPRAERPA